MVLFSPLFCLHLVAVAYFFTLARPVSGIVLPILRRGNEAGYTYRQLYTGTNDCGTVFSKPWVERTVHGLSTQEKISKTIAYIDKHCTRLEHIDENKSWAEEAIEPYGGNYRPRFAIRPEKGFDDPSTFVGEWPTHIEIICIALASRGAADLGDAEGLTKKIPAESCDAFELYTPRQTHCLDVNKNGDARATICSPPAIRDETFTYKKSLSLFKVAEEGLDHMHGSKHCWFRENVLPYLVTKHCRDERFPGMVRGTVRVGKLVDEQRWCKKNDAKAMLMGRCEQKWKVVWVFDLAVAA